MQPSFGSSLPPPYVSSRAQSALQPSPSVRFPSSHSSPRSTIPSPHSLVQAAEQPSPLTVLPSSHSSPGSTRPLPQRKQPVRSKRQTASQARGPPASPSDRPG